MIEFHFETDFKLTETKKHADWVERICVSEGYSAGDINFIFCDDSFLLEINKKHLQHDTYTDIITFDYTIGRKISGDIYISIERVQENAETYGVSLTNELLRVMAHGLLHLAGYQDKKEKHIKEMRFKEEEKIKMFHVEQ
ncbi:rRNA maturation RNase YbeY [Maribacter sp. PR1]|uniref:Endoribonuclease YbeY n=1 Tax=Maribacter cobaltidurans TaxID=1178778 RepID=A0ABU7IRC7_9FLAO|nr:MULTISPECIES: rRNA maturation RNase YbeY [Maribacter]MDC6387839.1 rRNA maturation RNase YbeY [Maribacter sp. PR1]MEE1975228.1 rRNA maturation RNase YbeY [Maribacter cobaltidurans]